MNPTRPAGRLDGRVAIVTGASRGLGAAIAAAFAAQGAAVAVAARTSQSIDDRLPGSVHTVVERIRRGGGRALAVQCDVSEDDDLVRLVDQVRGAWGPINLVVNNAAVTVPGRPGHRVRPSALSAPTPATALAMPAKGLRRHLEVNVVAAYRLVQLTALDMIAAGQGAVINISSDAANRPGPGPYDDPAEALLLAYGTSKAALQTMTQYLACELSPHGVAVNALLPSAPIDTPGLRATAGTSIATVPIADFAEAAVRLALAKADTFTGQVAYHEDVLHPELGKRGWMAAT